MKRTSKAKTKVATKKSKRQKKYSIGVFVAAVTLLVTAESALILNADAADWKAGVSVLDVSGGVSRLASDFQFVTEPAVFTFGTVNEFYSQAAVASTQILDMSEESKDTLMFVFGINNFYKLASEELAHILDLSDYTTSWQPSVAGASVSR